MKAITVIDHQINSVFVYDVPENYSFDDIESFISDISQYTTENGIKEKPLHHLSNCSWGEFDGTINDYRE